MDVWWNHWKTYMFLEPVTIASKSSGGESKTLKVYELIQPIKKSKYPAITSEEEKISKPLQVLTLAIFDAILVHMMNTLQKELPPSSSGTWKSHNSGGDWSSIRNTICNKLNKNKNNRILEILTSPQTSSNSYSSHDILFLQEVGKSFLSNVKQNSQFNDLFELHLSQEPQATSREVICHQGCGGSL